MLFSCTGPLKLEKPFQGDVTALNIRPRRTDEIVFSSSSPLSISRRSWSFPSLPLCLSPHGRPRHGGRNPLPRYGVSLADHHLPDHTIQDVIYEDKAHLDRVLSKLRRLPPLVSPTEVRLSGFEQLVVSR